MIQNKWVSMWGNAVSIATHKPESYSKNITLRYPIYAPFSGNTLRFTFDNYCGTEPITISCATVATSASDTLTKTALSCPIQAESSVFITFSGEKEVTIAPGKSICSDEIPFSVTAGSQIAVSFYLANFTQMQSAVLISGPLSHACYSLGNQTLSAELPVNESKTTNWFYFLSNIDILTSAENHAIICYGDSITAQDWPDYLSLFLKESGNTNTAIIRRATSGSRILRQYDCITYDSYGLKGTNRFEHEVPTSGADTIIIQQGINDIIHPVGVEINQFRPMSDLPTVNEMIDGIRWYIEKARGYGYRILLGTLLPIHGWRTYAPFREEMRLEFNEWIRTTNEADGCVDFDLALRNPAFPTAFRDGYDSGDHLHPSATAYQEMARTALPFLSE
ncbi:MAG: GDSL-type esterase/lipase family protein [Roseburia sp.]